MRRLAQSKVTRRLATTLLPLVILGYFALQLMTPTIKLATRAQVEALLPPDLLAKTPVDKAAQSRLSEILEIQRTLDSSSRSEVEAEKTKTHGRLSAKTPGRPLTVAEVDQLDRIVRTGPLQSTAAVKGNDIFLVGRLLEGLSSTAFACQRRGDNRGLARCLLVSIKICDQLVASELGMFTQVIGDRSTLQTIRDIGRNPSTTQGVCATLLAALHPSQKEDPALASSQREQFQMLILPSLPNPYFDYKESDSDADDSSSDFPKFRFWKTSYEAVETTRAFGQLVTAMMANSKRFYRDYDDTADRIIEKARVSLPTNPDPMKTRIWERWWENTKYRVAVNMASNLMGKWMISLKGDSGRTEMQISLHHRSLRDDLRVLLASRLYRFSHNGLLPSRYQELIPYLGQWPTDLDDGKPMKYNRAKEVVYSVGTQLRDDGGETVAHNNATKDIGLSLALTK